MRKALTDRLARDGVRTADNQPTVLYARYREAAGKTLQVYQWGIMQPKREPPGTAEETKMALEVGFRMGENSEPLWRTFLSQGAGLIISGKGTTRDLHRDTFDRLKRDLGSLPLPYFLPAEGKTASLPLVSQL